MKSDERNWICVTVWIVRWYFFFYTNSLLLQINRLIEDRFWIKWFGQRQQIILPDSIQYQNFPNKSSSKEFKICAIHFYFFILFNRSETLESVGFLVTYNPLYLHIDQMYTYRTLLFEVIHVYMILISRLHRSIQFKFRREASKSRFRITIGNFKRNIS